MSSSLLRLTSLLLPLLSLSYIPLTSATPSSLTINFTPLSSAPNTAHPLAQLSLTPTPHLTSYTPPALPASSSSSFDPDEQLLRISLSTTTTTTSTTTTSSTLATLAGLHAPNGTFRIHLSALDNATIAVSYHVPFPLVSRGSSNSSSTEGQSGKAAWPGVEIVYPAPGPQAFLNQPVVLNEAGKVEEKEVEKTFLQK
ncbi:hypothetical protein MMC19_006781 [Ptychographa xylographoides]|nr:hypothetical protein [Ptychographa xylographoides]